MFVSDWTRSPVITIFRASYSDRRRWAALLLCALVAVGCLACGKRGSPRPPLPRGPGPPENVVVRQLGRRALVSFRVAGAKGGSPAQQPVRVELLRVTYPPGQEPLTDSDAFRRRGDVVAQLVGDPLESGADVMLEDLRLNELGQNAQGWTLRYGVRVRDRRGRPSALVVARDLRFLPWIASPGALTAEPTAAGVRLRWEDSSQIKDVVFNVYRSLPDSPWPQEPINGEPVEGPEYLDATVETGLRYLYTVRPVLASDRPFREGEPSSTAELVAVDRFPPDTPSGLVAVQEGTAVRLFWSPNGERDLAGYRVERSNDGDVWARVGVVDSPSFLDTEVTGMREVSYRVSAFDRSQPPNSSDPSPPSRIRLAAEAARP